MKPEAMTSYLGGNPGVFPKIEFFEIPALFLNSNRRFSIYENLDGQDLRKKCVFLLFHI